MSLTASLGEDIAPADGAAPALRGSGARQLYDWIGNCAANAGPEAAPDVATFARPCRAVPPGFNETYDAIRLYVEPKLGLHSKIMDAASLTVSYSNGEAEKSQVKVNFLGTQGFWDGTWSKVCDIDGACYGYEKRFKSYDGYEVFGSPASAGFFILRYWLKVDDRCTFVRTWGVDDYSDKKCEDY